MPTDIVLATDNFDFSKYRPGDTIFVEHGDAIMLGPLMPAMLERLTTAAERAGLTYTIAESLADNGLRITFGEPTAP